MLHRYSIGAVAKRVKERLFHCDSLLPEILPQMREKNKK
jgi:hypothetical protein